MIELPASEIDCLEEFASNFAALSSSSAKVRNAAMFRIFFMTVPLPAARAQFRRGAFVYV
jgi:hypothetical protein